MTKKATDATGDGEQEKGAGEVTYRLWIDYRPACYVDGAHTDTPPDPDGARRFAAYRALIHLEALFQLMALAGAGQIDNAHGEDLANLFENIGELGAHIAIAAYSQIDDMGSA